MGGSRHNGFRASQVPHIVDLFLQSVSLRSRKRTFSERYLRLVKLRNFDLPEDTATKRPCRVYYTYMRKMCPLRMLRICHYIIRDWRGLAELLILVNRQCEGLTSGISKKVSPTSFFVSITIVLTLMPKQGEW